MSFHPPADGPGQLLPLRPLTVADLLDGAFRILRSLAGPLVLLVLAIYAPYHLASSFLTARMIPELQDPVAVERFFETAEPDLELLARLFTVGGGFAIVALLLNVIVGGAIVWLVLARDRGQDVTLPAALRAGLARSGATLGAATLTVLGALAVTLGGGLLTVATTPFLGLVVLPFAALAWLVAVAMLFLLLPVAIAEGGGPLRTFGRTVTLLRRRFGRILGLTVLTAIVLIAVAAGVTVLLSQLALLAGPFAWLVEAVGSTLLRMLALPVAVLVALLVYVDVRVRFEGLDLQLRAQQLPRG